MQLFIKFLIFAGLRLTQKIYTAEVSRQVGGLSGKMKVGRPGAEAALGDQGSRACSPGALPAVLTPCWAVRALQLP